MKLKLLCIALSAALMTMACNQVQKPPQATKPMGSKTPMRSNNVTQVLYPVDSAQNDIASFDTLCEAYFQKNIPVKAFTIRAVDLFAAMGMQYDSTKCGFHHIRVYLGYNASHKFKLFIIPVKGADLNAPDMNPGDDYMLDVNGNAVPPNTGGVGQFVLDLNTPCPSTCDPKSPLMQTQTRKH